MIGIDVVLIVFAAWISLVTIFITVISENVREMKKKVQELEADRTKMVIKLSELSEVVDYIPPR